jgi:hypothetical protein
MKMHLIFLNDHSGSMQGITRYAMADYNSVTKAAADAAAAHNIPSTFTTISFGKYNGGRFAGRGYAPMLESQFVPSDIAKAMTSWPADGGTPLWEALILAINTAMSAPDYADPETTFNVVLTTDGQATDDYEYGGAAQKLMKECIATDRWTFVFRVPRGGARSIIQKGVDEGNVIEWEQSAKGVADSTAATSRGMQDMYLGRTQGVRSTKTFYSSLKDVTSADVKAVLTDISKEVQLWPVSAPEAGTQIRTFVESRLNDGKGGKLLKGGAFYQLVKTETKIQDYKLIAIRDKTSASIYCGAAARDMLGLPKYGDVRVAPQDHGNFDVFIQSTSVNRKVDAGTQIMYWPGVGVAYKEGASA